MWGLRLAWIVQGSDHVTSHAFSAIRLVVESALCLSCRFRDVLHQADSHSGTSN